MKTIDERVVEMRFDNKQFETGAAITMSTIQKLKKSLDFTKIGDSFKNIDKAANNVNLSGLDRTISGLTNKFSALEVMAITTLGNITNSFVNSAKRWVSEFTIAPIKSGFQEYETQINAVQTILANTQKEGTNIKDVNAALDELNLYADKTIYNFTEMTRNIGTFTAAGVDLKTSVGAIQGIANLAAVSGSNSQQASTAMYQLSQALATGTVKLMDWNSVVNAGMGGQLFQDALKETSRLLGTGADAAIEAEGSFRESLKNGWLTSEVLTETLKKFTTSGAAEYVANYTGLSKEAIEAELELAKSTYGEVEAIDKAAEALAEKSGKNKDEIAETLRFAKTAEDAATKVKTFTQLIDTLKEAVQSGWSQSFRIIVGDFEEAKELFTEISDSFGAVIGASADARNKLLSEVFNKKDAQDYMASVVDVPKEAITELQTVAKEAGTTSDLFKDTLNTFTEGDETLNKVMTHMIGMVSSEKDVITYVSDITGMEEGSIKHLQDLGEEFGYTSDEVKDFANVLAEGDSEMESTIMHLLQMNDAMQKPSGRELLIDSLRNGLKGLVSAIKPVQEAFGEVFPPTTAEQVYGMLEGFHEFTKALTLSEKNTKSIKRAFKGLFDITKLLGDGFVSLIKIIVPIEEPVGALGEGIIGLAGAVGDLLSTTSKQIRSSKTLARDVDFLRSSYSSLMGGLTKLIKTGIIFIDELSKMEGTVKLIDSVNNAFSRFYNKVYPYIDSFMSKSEKLFGSLFGFEDINVDDTLKAVSDAFANLALEIDNFSFEVAWGSFDVLKSKVKEFYDLLMSNGGIATFFKNFKKYGENLRDAFSLDNLLERLEKIMDVFGRFFNWVKTGATAAFKDFNIGSAIAASGGIGIVYTLVTLAKSFKAISKTFESFKVFPDLLGSIKGVLVAYQNDLKAESLIKIAKAIGIFAVAITVLSFADMENAWQAAGMIGLVGAALIAAFGYLTKAKNSANAADDAIRSIAETIKNSADSLTGSVRSLADAVEKSMKRKSLASFIKTFAKSILIIFLSIAGLGLMWRKDQEAFKAGVAGVAGITGALIAISALSGIAAEFGNTKGMSEISKSLLMFAASLGLIIFAISSLMKMKLPEDYGKHLVLLYGILAALAGLTTVLSLDAWLAGGNELPKMSKVIKSLTIMLLVTILSLKMLFGMKIPEDYDQRFDMFKDIFYGLALIVIAMGVAARVSKGQGFKAAATILAMAGFLVAVTASLLVLSVMPVYKLAVGAIALGGILVALGVALGEAGKTVDKNAVKTVLGMAVSIGIVTAALSILSIVPWAKLLTSAGSLGVVMLSLSVAFLAVSKVDPKKGIPTMIAMTASLGVIVASLFVLSSKPWEGIVAAAASMSLVVVSLAGAFAIIEHSNIKMDSIIAFVAAAISCIPLAYAMQMIAGTENMLLSAATLAAVALALSGALTIMGVIGPAIVSGTIAFVAAAVACIPIAYAMKMLSGLSWSDVATGLVTLAGALAIIGVAGVAFGAIAGPMIAGSAALGVFSIAIVAAGLSVVVFVGSIATAMDLLGQLLAGLGNLSDYAEAGKNLIAGFISGVIEGFKSLIEVVKNIGEKVLGIIDDVFDMHSPSEEMRRRGVNVDKGFSGGLFDGAGSIDTAMQSVFGNLTNKINVDDFNLSGKDASELFGSGFSSGGNDISTLLSGVVQNANLGIDTSAFTDTGMLAGMDFSKGLEGFDSSVLSSSIEGLADSVDISSFTDTGMLAGMDFSKGFSGIDTSALTSSMSGIASNLDTSSFTNGGQVASSKFVESFNTGLSSKQGEISSTISSLAVSMASSLASNSSPIIAAGRLSIGYWITGMQSKFPEISVNALTISNQLLIALRLSNPLFLLEGILTISQYLIGIRSKYIESRNVGTTIANNVLGGCQAVLTSFYRAGANAGQGFVNGIKSKLGEARAAGRAIAEAAYNAAKEALDEHSPSKKMGLVGDFAGLGFVQQLLAHVAASKEAGKELGEAAYKGATSVISTMDDFDVNPMIHPRVDLDDVKKSVSDINKMFNDSILYTAKMASSTSASVKANKKSGEIQNDGLKDSSNAGNTYQFVQNNYSPKALSRIDIYRDTKNQISQFKEATNNK